MTELDHDVLLVVYKPAGLRRACSPAEAAQLVGAWNAILDWLDGSDPDELPYSDLLGEVARKAALRTPRFPAYNITVWARQAAGLARVRLDSVGERHLIAVYEAILTGLRLVKISEERRWLNRVAIEVLYGATWAFHRHRDGLTQRLLDGPVLVQQWTGDRKELAQAAKILVRRSLSTAPMSNLIHMETADGGTVDCLLRATDIPEIGCGARARMPESYA